MSDDPTKLLKKDLIALYNMLKLERDELQLQLHLAKAEARDEWHHLEKKWETFHERASVVGEAAAEASKEVSAATGILAEEIKRGYEHIREAITGKD